MPISLKTYRNCKISGNTPQTQQAVAHHKRRNLTKNRPFLDIHAFISHVAIEFSQTTESLIAAREIAMLANNHTPVPSFTMKTHFQAQKKRDRRAFSTPQYQPKSGKNSKKTDEPPRKKGTQPLTQIKEDALFSPTNSTYHTVCQTKKTACFPAKTATHAKHTVNLWNGAKIIDFLCNILPRKIW